MNNSIMITAKFNSVCKCGNKVKRGERVLYFPRLKKVLCTTCTSRQESDNRAARSMERFGNDCSYDY